MIDEIKDMRKFKSEGKERIAYGDINGDNYELTMTAYKILLKKRGNVVLYKRFSSLKQANKIFEKLKKKHKFIEKKFIGLPRHWNDI